MPCPYFLLNPARTVRGHHFPSPAVSPASLQSESELSSAGGAFKNMHQTFVIPYLYSNYLFERERG